MLSSSWLVSCTHGACIFVAGAENSSYFLVAAGGCVNLTTEENGYIIQTRRKHVCKLSKSFAMNHNSRCQNARREGSEIASFQLAEQLRHTWLGSVDNAIRQCFQHSLVVHVVSVLEDARVRTERPSARGLA